jgi:hypothetical protein
MVTVGDDGSLFVFPPAKVRLNDIDPNLSARPSPTTNAWSHRSA